MMNELDTLLDKENEKITKRLTKNAVSYEALRRFAKILAVENINVSFGTKSDTACFDTKNRHLIIPLFFLDNEHAVDYVLAHEVGHAVFTRGKIAEFWSAKANFTPFQKSVANIFEDIRIEHLMKQKFWGLNESFDLGPKYLLSQDFFGNSIGWNTLDAVNVYAKTASKEALRKLPQESRNHIQGIIDRAGSINKSYDYILELIQYYENLYSLAKAPPIKSVDPEENPVLKEVEPITLPEEIEDTETDNSVEEDLDIPEYKEDEDVIDEDIIDEDIVDEDEPSPEEISKAEKLLGYGQVSINSFESKLKDSIKNDVINSKEVAGLSYSRLDMVDPATFNYTIRSKDVKTLADLLISDFNRKKFAWETQNSTAQKRGSIDAKRLTRLKVSDDIFHRKISTPTGRTNGMVIIIDGSSSMCGMNGINETAASLINFCARAKIPFTLNIFANHLLHGSKQPIGRISKLPGYNNTAITEVFSYNGISSTIAANASNALKLCAKYIRFHGSTPLVETILNLDSIINRFRVITNRNPCEDITVAFITDGCSNNATPTKNISFCNTTIATDQLQVRYGNQCFQKSLLLAYRNANPHIRLLNFFLGNNFKNFMDMFEREIPISNSIINLMESKLEEEAHISVRNCGGFHTNYLIKHDKLTDKDKSRTLMRTFSKDIVDNILSI